MSQNKMIDLLKKLQNGSFVTVEKESEHKMKKTGNPLRDRKVVKRSRFQLQVGCSTQNIENNIAKRENREPRTIGSLPWGEYVDGLPLITHKGNLYLRGHWTKGLETEYTVDGQSATPEQVETIKAFTSSRPLDKQSAMTIKLEGIKRLAAGGETVTN